MKRTWKWICDNPSKHKTCSKCYRLNSYGRKKCVHCGHDKFQGEIPFIRSERFLAARDSQKDDYIMEL